MYIASDAARAGYQSPLLQRQQCRVCVAMQIVPLLGLARQDHPQHWRERLTDPTRLAEDATPMLTMVHRVRTTAGKAADAMRKQAV